MVVQAGRRGSGGGSKDGPIGATPEAGEGAEVEGGGEEGPFGEDVVEAHRKVGERDLNGRLKEGLGARRTLDRLRRRIVRRRP